MALWLFAAGLLAALAYLPLTGAEPSRHRSVLKTAPLVLFTAAAWQAGAPVALIAALGLSAIGDLALSRPGHAGLRPGLAAFGLAHLLYVLGFLSLSGLPLWAALSAAPLAVAAMILLALSSEVWLAPFTGALRWPVRLYVVLFSLMLLASLTLPLSLAFIRIGAALFVLSDLLLALQLFRLSADGGWQRPAGVLVWTFYSAGQALILAPLLAP